MITIVIIIAMIIMIITIILIIVVITIINSPFQSASFSTGSTIVTAYLAIILQVFGKLSTLPIEHSLISINPCDIIEYIYIYIYI